MSGPSDIPWPRPMTAADRYEAEHMTPPRPEPVATADLVAQARAILTAAERGQWHEAHITPDLLTALAKALEDTMAERDRAHATLLGIESLAKYERRGWMDFKRIARLARERLANP